MSGLADFRLIETSKLKDLRNAAEIKFERGFLSKMKIDGYPRFLEMNAKKLKDFKWSGFVFAHLLVFLKEKKGINLLDNEFTPDAMDIANKRQNSTIIFTYNQKQESIYKLIPDNFNLQELIDFNKEFSNEANPELAKVELEGVKSLKENLEFIIDDNVVILLSIG